jgi:glycosyltransferase involved in cell wall biosynthesis
MTAPTFTILLPVHRPPVMLPYAIQSVLAQARQDFELFIICDGAPAETESCARDFAARDPRIKAFVHPKGQRHGEVYRHEALQQARGVYVCQIGDDDLWFPSHLDEMEALLRNVDFGNVSHVEVRADGRVLLLPGDLGEAAVRERMLQTPFNFFGPTVAGYRLSAYRSLPVGWSPAPPDLPTDLHMWRKFLVREDLRFGTKVAVTSVKCSARERHDWPLDQRAAEVKEWAERAATPSGRRAIVQTALGEMNRRFYAAQIGQSQLQAQVRSLRERLNKSEREKAALRIRCEKTAHRLSELQQRFVRLKRTWSWRLTRPFRKAARLFTR